MRSAELAPTVPKFRAASSGVAHVGHRLAAEVGTAQVGQHLGHRNGRVVEPAAGFFICMKASWSGKPDGSAPRSCTWAVGTLSGLHAKPGALVCLVGGGGLFRMAPEIDLAARNAVPRRLVGHTAVRESVLPAM